MSSDISTKKIKDSRILRYSLGIILILAVLYIISTTVITILTCKAMETGTTADVANMVEIVSNYIKIEVAGAIGTIGTAVIARYGLREVSANIAKKDYNMEE